MLFEVSTVLSDSESSDSEQITPDSTSEESSIIDENQQVDHLVFVIHGIGQQIEKYGMFYEHMDELRETTKAVLSTRLPDANLRIELIPIEWHRMLHSHVDEAMESITLKSIPTIRLIENDYLADAFYYLTADRGQKIVDYVVNTLNTSYKHFIERYPNFTGKIAIFGYSLGGMITYDILSAQRLHLDSTENDGDHGEDADYVTEEQMESYNKSPLKIPKLDFKPDWFFGIGSPMGALMVFRNQIPAHYRPDRRIMFENLFHSFDPLGYRFEPLLYTVYRDLPAVPVDRASPSTGYYPSFALPAFSALSVTSFFSSVSFASFSLPRWGTRQNECVDHDSSRQVISSEVTKNTFLGRVAHYFGNNHLNTTENNDANIHRQQNVNHLEMNIDQAARTYKGREEVDATAQIKEQKSKARATRPSRRRAKSDIDLFTPFMDFPSKAGPGVENGGDYFSKRPEQRRRSHSKQRVEVLDVDGNPRGKFSRRPSANILEDLQQELTTPISKGIWGIEEEAPRSSRHQKKSSRANNNHSGNAEIGRETPGEVLKDVVGEMMEGDKDITNPEEWKKEAAKVTTVPNGSSAIDGSEDELDESSLPLPRRIDYVLQPETFMDMIANEYLVGVRAHFSYWNSRDLMWHILRRMENIDESYQDTGNLKTTENSY